MVTAPDRDRERGAGRLPKEEGKSGARRAPIADAYLVMITNNDALQENDLRPLIMSQVLENECGEC